MKSDIFERFLEVGCCKICSLRFRGETDVDVYKDFISKENTEFSRRQVRGLINSIQNIAGFSWLGYLNNK